MYSIETGGKCLCCSVGNALDKCQFVVDSKEVRIYELPFGGYIFDFQRINDIFMK